MRTRIKDERYDRLVTKYTDNTYTNECEGVESSFTLSNLDGRYQRTSDVVTPNYHKRSANGEIIVNPFSSYTEERMCVSPGWGRIRRVSGGYQCYEWSSDGPLWYPNDGERRLFHLDAASVNTANLRKLADTQAKANVKKPEVQSLVTLGELRETISYLRNPVKSLTKYIERNRTEIKRDLRREQIYLRRLRKSLKRGSSLSTAQAVAAGKRNSKSNIVSRLIRSNEVEAISSTYLSGRYGLRPLIGEIQGIAKAIDSRKDIKPSRFTARGHASDEDTAEATFAAVSPTSFWSGDQEVETLQEAEARSGIVYDVSIRDTWGTDLSQVPVALWELTFLSFMADWFANMGDYLAAVTPKSGIRVRGSWSVIRKVTRTKASYNYTPNIPNSEYSVIINPNGEETVVSTYVHRVPSVKAGLAYRPSGVNFDLGAARIADMFGIARSLLF